MVQYEVVTERVDRGSTACSSFPPANRWAWNALNLTDYAGDANDFCTIAVSLRPLKGRILEAMCGHHSYFARKSGATITAIDFCRESLLRYPHKSAKRVCCDLNQISGGETLHFFKENYFDAISICFGYKYPDNIDALISEFKRILKSGGKLSFVESAIHSYKELAKRDFSPRLIKRSLHRAGFENVCVTRLSQGRAIIMKGLDSSIYQVQSTK